MQISGMESCSLCIAHIHALRTLTLTLARSKEKNTIPMLKQSSILHILAPVCQALDYQASYTTTVVLKFSMAHVKATSMTLEVQFICKIVYISNLIHSSHSYYPVIHVLLQKVSKFSAQLCKSQIQSLSNRPCMTKHSEHGLIWRVVSDHSGEC